MARLTAPPAGPVSRRIIPPAVALLFLAPLLGELVSGHQAPLQFFNPIVFLALALPYGCGALLCRELARRRGAGWPALLLLSVAYGLYEEGVVSRALFDPRWREAEALVQYDHVAGVNLTYGFMLIHFHVTVSVAASVMLAELLYPARRDQPWLSNPQAVACGLVLLLWAPALALLARSDQPLYVPAPSLWAVTGLAIAGLVLAAWRVHPPRAAFTSRPAPHPLRFLILGAANMTAVFGIVFILPDAGARPPLALAMATLVALDVATLWLVLRWSGRMRVWDDRHRLALVTGLLSFFVVFGVLSDLERFEGKSLVSLAAVLGLFYVARSVRRRVANVPPEARAGLAS